MNKLFVALFVVAVIVLAVATITLTIKADVAIWQSDMPWWVKLKLIGR